MKPFSIIVRFNTKVSYNTETGELSGNKGTAIWGCSSGNSVTGLNSNTIRCTGFKIKDQGHSGHSSRRPYLG